MNRLRFAFRVTSAVLCVSLVCSLVGCGGGLSALSGGGGDFDFPREYQWNRAVTFGFPDPAIATDIQGTPIVAQKLDDPGKYRNAFAHWASFANCDDKGVCAPRLTLSEAPAGQHADIDIVVQDASQITRDVTRERALPNVAVAEERAEPEPGRATGILLATCSVYLPDPSNSNLGRAVIRVRSDMQSGDVGTGVADHEAGHSLGLKHVSNPLARMYKIVFGAATRVFGFTSDDKRAIRTLYSNAND